MYIISQVFLNNYHGDCSKTFLIGDVDEQGKELVNITEECLMKVKNTIVSFL